MNQTIEISKVLSANDIGATGGHQAGILVPKDLHILGFFPDLPSGTKNPRISLSFLEDDGITRWSFNFIYYNNRFFDGTRNEYRLTCMTKYLIARNAKAGDRLVLLKDHEGRRSIRINRTDEAGSLSKGDVLVLSGCWKVIKIN